MKKIEELGVTPGEWSVEDTLKSYPIQTFAVKSPYCRVAVNLLGPDAKLVAGAKKMYDRLYRLVNEINKVIDHTEAGDTVIDCDCSGIELAKVEAEEVLDEISGAKREDVDNVYRDM